MPYYYLLTYLLTYSSSCVLAHNADKAFTIVKPRSCPFVNGSLFMSENTECKAINHQYVPLINKSMNFNLYALSILECKSITTIARFTVYREGPVDCVEQFGRIAASVANSWAVHRHIRPRNALVLCTATVVVYEAKATRAARTTTSRTQPRVDDSPRNPN